MGNYVLNNATIVPMTGPDDVVENGSIVIENGAIAEVRDAPVDFSAAPVPDAELVDLDGKVVMPGLVNAHTHLYQTLLRATWEDIPLIPWLRNVYWTAEVLEPFDLFVGTQLGAAEAIKSGVTTVVEHQFLNPTYEHTIATAEAIRTSGLRGVLARTIMDTGDIVPPSVTEDPEAALAEVERLLDEYDSDPLFQVWTGPNTPPINTSTDCCRAIARFCDEHPGVGISAHVAESEGVIEHLHEHYDDDGVVEYLDRVGLTGSDVVYAHCVHLNGPEITLMANTDSTISHNPVSNMMLGDGIAPLAEALEEGVNVGLGTDGAASNHSQDMVEVMKFTSLLHKVHHMDPAVLTPYQVIEMATVNGAKALNLEAEVGTVEEGKRADLIVLDLEGAIHNVTVNDRYSGIVHTMKASDVRSTMVDGEFLMRDRTLLTMDETFLRKQGQETGRDLGRRVDELDL